MKTSLVDGYRSVRRGAIALALGATVTLGGILGAFAADGTFEEAARSRAAATRSTSTRPPRTRSPTTTPPTPTGPARTARAPTSPTTAPSGASYYTWEDQPADYKWEPAAVAYGEAHYVFYDGEDGKYLPQRLRRRRVDRLGGHLRRVRVRRRPVRQRLRRRRSTSTAPPTDGYVYDKYLRRQRAGPTGPR